MEKKVLKTEFTLPPNVNGRCRGRLSLCLHDIKWHTEEISQFNWIQAKIIWWGDKFNTGATLKLKNQEQQAKFTSHAVQYNVLTRLPLFKNYLLSSGNVSVKFSSGTSNINIGTANIPIPGDLIAFIDQQSKRNSTGREKFQSDCYIFDLQKEFIGTFVLGWEMIVETQALNMDGHSSHKRCNKTKKDHGIENNMNQFNLKLYSPDGKLNVQTSESRKSPRSKDSANKLHTELPVLNPRQVSTKSSKPSTLLSYLTGRPLDAHEENEAVRAIESTSPTGSLIDFLSHDLEGLYPLETPHDIEAKMLKKIDCLRLQIDDMCLTRAGIREILSKHTPNETNYSSGTHCRVCGTFIIDVDVDAMASESPFKKCVSFSSKVTRIFSSSVESIPPCVELNRVSIHKLNEFHKRSRGPRMTGDISLTIRYRDIESCASRAFGVAGLRFSDVLKANNLSFQQYCPVKIKGSDIVVGRLTIKAELGCRGLHFGADFLEAFSLRSADVERSETSDFYNLRPAFTSPLTQCNNRCDHKPRSSDSFQMTCLYDVHDDQTKDNSENPSTLDLDDFSCGGQKSSNENKRNDFTDANEGISHKIGESDDMASENGNDLNVLFHIGQANYCSWHQSMLDTFLVCRPFWVDSALVTESCQTKTEDENYHLNYLEIHSVICDQKLLESAKHGFMSIEIWQRGNNKANTLVGSARVPLHQFFIAFNNNSIRNHVSKQELPVTSIDGWVAITNATSSSDTPVGTVQTILAVGTRKQINSLRQSKNLLSCNRFLRHSLELYPLHHVPASSATVRSETETSPKDVLPPLMGDRHSNLASMFSSFIDNLASRLPDRNTAPNETPTNDATTQTNNGTYSRVIANSNQNGKYMRPTSELLDELQRALAVAPATVPKSPIPTAKVSTPTAITEPTPKELELDSKDSKRFRVHIEIESALHLPSLAAPVSKKGGKRNRNVNAKKIDLQPSTYATFEACADNEAGKLTSYCTNVVECSCSPLWNKQFEVFLPIEFLHNDEKRFVIRVLRKIYDSSTLRAPNDVAIGFASIDLSVLLAGLPSITGWFNIIDHSGCINGQIKVHIKPKDDLAPLKRQPSSETSGRPVIDLVQSPKCDEIPPTASPDGGRSVDDSALSRALKRKFTELEEITQRLRARLFDVTGNMAIDPDDQFENDLNTIPDEDDDFEVSNIASEMSLDWLVHCQNQVSSDESFDKFNFTPNSMGSQLRDFLDFLSPEQGEVQATQTKDNHEQQSGLSDSNKLRSRLNELLKENATTSTTKKGEEDSVENIAETLEKSIINE